MPLCETRGERSCDSPQRSGVVKRILFGVAVAIFVRADCSFAQPATSWTLPVAVGTRVRVSTQATGSSQLVGSYLGLAGDSLRLALATTATIAIPVRDVAWVEASAGRPRLRFLAAGLIGGGVAGVLIGAAQGERKDPGGVGGLVGLIVGGFTGAAIGGLAAALWAPERWTRYLNPQR
jgi:hypothetical protein